MGVANLGEIANGLMAAGISAAMPACAIQNGTRDNQRHVISSLGAMAADVMAAELSSPAIVVIGEVVSLASNAFLQSSFFDALAAA